MIDVEDTLRAELHRLVPIDSRRNWNQVIANAGLKPGAGRFLHGRLSGRRRLVVILVALAVALIPLAAFAASNDWWFLRFDTAPKPLHSPVVVKEGEWSGHPWQLVVYPSTTDGLCVSVTPKDSAQNGVVGALECGPFSGISRTPGTKTSPDVTITYLSSTGANAVSYVVGPVIDKATEVEIHFANGQVRRVPTFGAPAPLEHIRFYAMQVPASFVPLRPRPRPTGKPGGPPTVRLPGEPLFLRWVAGLDEHGKVVACLAPMSATNGISPLSACR